MFRLQITSVLHIHAGDVASGGKFHNCFDGFTPVAHEDGAGQPRARAARTAVAQMCTGQHGRQETDEGSEAPGFKAQRRTAKRVKAEALHLILSHTCLRPLRSPPQDIRAPACLQVSCATAQAGAFDVTCVSPAGGSPKVGQDRPGHMAVDRPPLRGVFSPHRSSVLLINPHLIYAIYS